MSWPLQDIWISLTYKIVLILCLVTTLPWWVLYPARRNNALLRIRNISFQKWMSSVISVVSIFFRLRPTGICWNGYLRLIKNACGYFPCSFKTKKWFILFAYFVSTSDYLFSNFTAFMPLLSPNAILWSFCMITVFFQAMTTEFQEAV